MNLLIVHCAATPPNLDIGAKEINQWHRQRGFFNAETGLAIGYHYVIRRDGTIETGRPEHVIGAHTKGYNSTSIGICLVGGVKLDKKTAENNFTDAQWTSLKKLLKELMEKYSLTPSAIHGHNEFAAKACPSFNVPEWVKKNLEV